MDLKRFVRALNPGKVVPIHTFQPGQYEKMYPNVEVHGDVQWWSAHLFIIFMEISFTRVETCSR